MAIKLTITFVGLFTFTQRGNRTFVLAPSTAGHAHHGMPEHEAWLFLGPANLTTKPTPAPFGISLKRRVLTIEDATPADGAPKLPDNLIDLRAITGKSVSDDLLGASPAAARVASRVDLVLHGTVESLAVGEFTLDDDPAHLDPTRPRKTTASYVRWTETLLDSDLRLRVTDMDGGGTIDLRSPHFVDGKGNVNLTIFYVVPEELPPATPTEVTPPLRIDHWPAMYQLFDAPASTPSLTLVASTKDAHGLQPNTCPQGQG